MSYTIDNPKLVKNFENPKERNFTGVVKDEHDDIAYYQNGKIHRIDRPALIARAGYKVWYIHGKIHREDGPAVEFDNGKKGWYYNHKWHGWDDDFTMESWVKKWKLEIFK